MVTVDPHSYQLAEYFLQEEKNVDEAATMRLAGTIQEAIEDWLKEWRDAQPGEVISIDASQAVMGQYADRVYDPPAGFGFYGTGIGRLNEPVQRTVEYVIRLKNGFYYSGMDGERIMVALIMSAHRFPTRMAALAACGQSSGFADAVIEEAGNV
jgi:hypothetical protein